MDAKLNDINAEAWTVAIGNFSLMPWMRKNNERAMKLIKSLNGFYGVHPVYPRGTLLLFATENDAKRARNTLRSKGIQVGNNICKCFIPKEYAKTAKEEEDNNGLQ